MTLPSTNLSLTIENGLQAGASLALPPGQHRVGSGLDCDVVVVDSCLAAAHFAIEDAPTPLLRALDAKVQVRGGRALQPGEACPIRRPLRFTAGATQFRLCPPRPAPAAGSHAWRSRTALAGVLAIGAVAFLVIQATPAGTATVAAAFTPPPAPVAAVPPARPAAGVAAALADRLAAAGLAEAHSSMNTDGTLQVSGTVAPEQQAAWSEIKRWFDGAYGAQAVLVDRVSLSAPAAPLSIAAVRPGASPFVIDRSGQKLFPGSILPGGWVVDTIEPTRVLVRRNGQALAVRF